MIDVLLGSWPLTVSVAVFATAAVVTVVGSIRMAFLGDTLADRTGWGEALFGAVFFGAATSLSGIVMTAVAAAANDPELAYSNAVGGIAAQTAAIAVVDMAYSRGNLEHVAASLSNILFGCLLIALLTLVVMAAFVPPVTVAAIHPMSVVIVAVYVGGLMLIRSSSERPMWQAVRTRATLEDQPAADEGQDRRPTRSLWLEFVCVGSVVAVGGGAVARAAESIVAATGLTAGFVGAVFMGGVNALPETVTAIAAVRRGAPTLAIAAILGGNCLDALNVVVGDVAFRGGSLYHAATPDELFLSLAGVLMTVVVVAGLLVRQDRGWARVGFEGVLLVGIYASIVAVLAI
ncbi:sodium:calcium antiporter [Pseudonocardia sp. H11422]|uniref:sodium:calcium antiporter n=1 Tax=Pseudonocardia sp. H11422 TaxID=2835866 RepID=UPI001BDBBFE9|nr:cation transporter [Pseudonocardia sp. H11422]